MTSTSDSPLLVLTTPSATPTTQCEGYAVAETIMRSGVAKRDELVRSPSDMRSASAAR